nr:unnamed protein product [Callosobruchus analis]
MESNRNSQKDKNLGDSVVKSIYPNDYKLRDKKSRTCVHCDVESDHDYICTYCKREFNSKRVLHDHIVKIHPDFIGTVTSKIHCGQNFKHNAALDNHILKRHPNFIATVTSNVYECIECPVKTTFKSYFDSHLLTHSKPRSKKVIACLHCKARLKSKRALDKHVIRKHPNFIA